MINFNKRLFEELADFHEPHCVSIFIPTHRAGQEVNQGLDRKALKNELKKAKNKLGNYKLAEKEIDACLQPATALLEEKDFWNYQSDGLAIFISKDFFEYFNLPVYFESFTYVSDHFYLKPLVPLFNEGGNFYILALSLHDVKLFEGKPYQIDEIVVDDLLPERLEEVVGFDYKQKYLQFREGQAGSEKTMFHGHGEGKDEKKEEVLKFFRAVNQGIMKVLHDKNAPLVIAAVDYLIPIYLEANEYKNVAKEHIKGNPEHTDAPLLYEKAMQILHTYFNSNKQEKIESYERELSRKKAAFKEEEVIQAAINGRVDTLFVRNRSSLWGNFEKESNSIRREDKSSLHAVDLLNLAAVETLLKGGEVYLLEEQEMPESSSKANAILRF
ncbi:MAG: hypothetical protein U5Q03_05075 [Bacteroidota bacterium]|nr:hypothetical protein [Bacteroidota bacterium]